MWVVLGLDMRCIIRLDPKHHVESQYRMQGRHFVVVWDARSLVSLPGAAVRKCVFHSKADSEVQNAATCGSQVWQLSTTARCSRLAWQLSMAAT